MEPPDTVREWFREAGWFPGRAVVVPAGVPAGHPARELLAAYGGLVLPEREPEDGWPVIEELRFEWLRPVPGLLVVWSMLLRSRLVGVARVHSDHAELWIDGNGRVFGRSLIHDAFYLHGLTVAEGLENLLVGRRARPMLRPGQFSTVLYGERYTRNSPEVWVDFG